MLDMTETTLHIAVIHPPEHHDHGFDWASQREHTLTPATRDAVAAMLEAYAPTTASLADLPQDPIGLVRFVERALPHADVTLVDVEEGVLDTWPTVGDADAWPTDVLLGVLDYLSYRQWCEIIGQHHDAYSLPLDEARSCVRCSGVAAVRDAMSYLPMRCEPYRRLSEALALAAVAGGAR